MSATFDQIETALLAPWVAVADGGLGQWDLTAAPVAWENVEFDPASQLAWMKVTIDAGQQTALTVDDAYTGTPVMMIEAFTPLGQGKQAARQLLDTAVAMYRGVQIKAVGGGATLRMYSVSRIMPLPYDGWFRLAVQISFRLV
jgi:hypothetical protein